MSDLDRISDVRERRVSEGCSGVDIVLERKCLLETEMSTRRLSVFIEAMPAKIYAGYRQQVGSEVDQTGGCATGVRQSLHLSSGDCDALRCHHLLLLLLTGRPFSS